MSHRTISALALATTLTGLAMPSLSQVLGDLPPRLTPPYTVVRTLAEPLQTQPGMPGSDLNLSGTVAYTRLSAGDMRAEGHYSQGTSDFGFSFWSGRVINPGCAGMSSVTLSYTRAGRMSSMGTYAATAYLARSATNSVYSLGMVLAADTVATVLCPALGGSDAHSEATAINAYQRVVGTSRQGSTIIATRWQLYGWGGSTQGTPVDLSAVSASTAAGAFPVGINKYGTIVGRGIPRLPSNVQGVWMKAEGQPAVELFSPNSLRPTATAINDKGVVVGTEGTRAWVFQPGVPAGLSQLPTAAGALVTQALGINNNDTIVGQSDGRPCYWKAVACATQPGRTCWDGPRMITSLTLPGHTLVQAVAISDTDSSNPREHLLVEGRTNGVNAAWVLRKNFD